MRIYLPSSPASLSGKLSENKIAANVKLVYYNKSHLNQIAIFFTKIKTTLRKCRIFYYFGLAIQHMVSQMKMTPKIF